MVFINLISIFLYLLAFVNLGDASTYSNPLRNPEGSDPFIVYTGGYYYLLTTTWTDVSISRATTLDGLKSSTKKVVYSTTTASRCCNVWSPEVHYFDGVWYIYYTAGETTDLDGQRVHVLVGKSPPLLSHKSLLIENRRRYTMGQLHLLRPTNIRVGYRRYDPPLH